MKNLIHDASIYAAAAHGAIGQKRKYTGDPYVVHCRAVARLVLSVVLKDDELAAAALLHDVLEDTKITAEDLLGIFPTGVVQLVMEVTDVSRPQDGNRAVRKGLDKDHLAKASPRGKTIKLADLLDNTDSIVLHDRDFAKVYMEEKRLLLPVLRGGDEYLYKLVEDRLAKYLKTGT